MFVERVSRCGRSSSNTVSFSGCEQYLTQVFKEKYKYQNIRNNLTREMEPKRKVENYRYRRLKQSPVEHERKHESSQFRESFPSFSVSLHSPTFKQLIKWLLRNKNKEQRKSKSLNRKQHYLIFLDMIST